MSKSEDIQQDQSSTPHPEFAIQRLYVKDISLETPNSPKIFLEPWKPEINLDLDTKAHPLDDDHREVVLTVTATVKIADKVAFLVEVKQAGIFTLKHFSDEQLDAMLASFCPNVLYPYAREAISDLVIRGGFPPLYLAPVNFDALYQQHKQKEQAEGKLH
ncbi:MAG TPA: protein-export chaperone SecB [Coxiellaceae bacterium]|nr:protein-export chaperone SecB [Coxiellaceae bacterium]